MRNMTIVELKPYVPAKDFALSKRFYQDLGFELAVIIQTATARRLEAGNGM
jgi:hypothetical protein